MEEKKLKSHQMAKAKSIYSGLDVGRESATVPCMWAETPSRQSWEPA